LVTFLDLGWAHRADVRCPYIGDKKHLLTMSLTDVRILEALGI